MFWAGVPKSVEEAGVLEYGRLISFQFLSLAGLLGAALAVRRRMPGWPLFAGAMLLLPLPYYAVTVQARFRHVLEPVICVLAVYLFGPQRASPAAAWAADAGKSSRHRTPEKAAGFSSLNRGSHKTGL